LAIPLAADPPTGEGSPVTYVERYRVKSARFDEAIAGSAKAVPAILRVGATGVPVALTDTGGSAVGHLVLSATFDSMAARGRCADVAAGDPEIAALTHQLHGADGPIQRASTLLLARVPL
jgi:hypothetical protein